VKKKHYDVHKNNIKNIFQVTGKLNEIFTKRLLIIDI